MNPLSARGDFAARLIARIRNEGPISIADYMRLCNAHYYATRDPFGAAGDFTTAPEISQVFGELIGAWCADYWGRMGAPDPVQLVELGPGRGTLMADALRATKRVPGFHQALKLHLVEQSPVLRQMQQEKLAAFSPYFHDDVGTLPTGPLLLIANEFFDALPIAQFERTDTGWHERKIRFSADSEKFEFYIDPAGTALGGIPDGALWLNAENGAVVELGVAAEKVAELLGMRVRRHGGAALVIDYARNTSPYGDTLQAVRAHHYHPVLASPGSADLTAHVDFQAIASAAAFGKAAAVYGPVSQAEFLIRLGIEARETALLKNASPAQQEAIRSGCRRLIEPTQMGTLFKVLGLTQPGGPVPAGFATP